MPQGCAVRMHDRVFGQVGETTRLWVLRDSRGDTSASEGGSRKWAGDARVQCKIYHGFSVARLRFAETLQHRKKMGLPCFGKAG